MYQERFYRKDFSKDWFSYRIDIKETDILVKSKSSLDEEVIKRLVAGYRSDIESYIEEYPEFKSTLSAFKIRGNPRPIVREMIEKSSVLDVGPMASVAGAIAEYLGRDLLAYSSELAVENGGDIFIKKKGDILVGMHGPAASAVNGLSLSLKEPPSYLGICSSSAVLGHSLSLGKADLATVISESAIFADGLATRLTNMVCLESDIYKALKFARKFSLTKAAVIAKGNRIGLWGKVKLIKR